MPPGADAGPFGDPAGGHAGPFGDPSGGQAGHSGASRSERAGQVAAADRHLAVAVDGLAGATLRRPALRTKASRVRDALTAVPDVALEEALGGLLDRLVRSVTRAGWCPEELAEVVRRRAGADLVPGLAAALARDARGTPTPGGAWCSQVEALGPPEPVRTHSVAGLAAGLGLAAALVDLPEVVPTLGRTSSGPAASAPPSAEAQARLGRVRALLAKAESTAYEEEAEALTAKAQELISEYALDRLLDDTEGAPAAPSAVTVRRLWLDAPYIVPKAHLVEAVARANRCRSVVVARLGMCTVVGDPEDLDAVELLVTSLLVQASSAMVAHGRHTDRDGTTRTRSFRKSFLVSFAGRIGERLREATRRVVDAGDAPETLLPALLSEDARVAEAFAELFPRLRVSRTQATNHEGWSAGRTAADLARLEVHDQVDGAREP